MKNLSQWLDEYSKDHQNPVNKKLHMICVPTIFLSVVAFFHLAPIEILSVSVGDLILLLVLVWYSTLSLKAYAIMAMQFVFSMALVYSAQTFFPDAAFYIFLCVFVVAWVGQFWGHHVEGRRPSFLTDLKYLLIGPLWVWMGKH